MPSRACSRRVLLPTPGSPPTSTTEPATRPPPSTRFEFVETGVDAGLSAGSTSVRRRGAGAAAGGPAPRRRGPGAGTASSAMVFH